MRRLTLTSLPSASAAPAAGLPQPRPGAAARRPLRPLLRGLQRIGFELGWDHARHGLPLPNGDAALQQGLLAGQARFAGHVLPATPRLQQWLGLRLQAWQEGRHIELLQVTPQYLSQLQTSHCPLTRMLLDQPGQPASAAVFDRVNPDAAYAAGNLVQLSQAAVQARRGLGFAAALQQAHRVEAGEPAHHQGLTGPQWRRAAVLCSFVEPLDHHRACEVPLLVLPPNRLRLLNPAQALQVFVSRQWLTPGWSQRINRLVEALPGGTPVRRAFQTFFHALLPRVMERGRPDNPQQARWALEDAWRNERVQQRWTAFAQRLTPAQCEKLVLQCSEQGLGQQQVCRLSLAQATEGWSLATRGLLPAARLVASGREAVDTAAGGWPSLASQPKTPTPWLQ